MLVFLIYLLKINNILFQQQEQDPTNLYIANLPLTYKEQDVDNMLVKYGQVISTRILRDPNGMSKGVGFARMESKEKCEQIIQIFNGSPLPGAKEALLVKFADGGNKKKSLYKNQDTGRMWRDANETMAAVTYDPNTLAQNGVATPHMLPAAIANYGRHYGTQTVPGYTMPGAPWVQQYLVPSAGHPHMPQVDETYGMPMGTAHMNAGYKGDGQHARGISVMMPATADPNGVQFNPMIPQLTTHMSALQLGSAGSVILNFILFDCLYPQFICFFLCFTVYKYTSVPVFRRWTDTLHNPHHADGGL